MSSKYIVPELEKKFIKDTVGVDLDAPPKLTHEEFMRLKEGNTDKTDSKFCMWEEGEECYIASHAVLRRDWED